MVYSENMLLFNYKINDKRVNRGTIVEKIYNGSGSGDYQFSGSHIRP